ncbi:MAG TPA: YbjN domain-containing protein [Parvularculaceae bacterium]|nr:YbjN domain-containing protein [Parvularculaceae bacterium]HNS87603.1 YbjN domain-containing protein [Parvularculaceae bacterium]
MSIELLKSPRADIDPLDALESVADEMELTVERVDAEELHLAIPGMWRDAGFWFTWRPELSTLQMGAPLDLKAPKGRIAEAARLVAMANERLWIGHFDLWSDDLSIVFRNSAVLPANGALDRVQAECLIKGAREAIDRFLPAFNYLIWGGKTPEEALEASLFETAGNA